MRTQINIRQAVESDKPIILDSWLSSMGIAHSWRLRDARTTVEDLWLTAHFAVACASDEPDQVFAWLCYEMAPRPTVFYIYTKQVYRKMGIASQLMGHVFPDKPTLQVAIHPPVQSHFGSLVRSFPKCVYNTFYLSARILCASHRSSVMQLSETQPEVD